MKIVNITRLICVVAILFSAMSCAKKRALSDNELALVFRDAFLSNAYTTNNRINLDSLRLYEPIFNKYGYTTEDVQYTIGSFATRKSARLSDVVERAIKMLEDVGKELDYQVGVLDTLDNLAIRRSARIVYQDSLIEMRSLQDTSKFILRFDHLEPANYDISFRYLIDELDTTPQNYTTQNWTEDREEEVEKGERRKRIRSKNGSLQRNVVSTYANNFVVSDTTHTAVIYLAMPSRKSGTPYLTIKDLTIKTKPTKEVARDSVFQELFTVRIFDDELLFTKQKAKDSL